MVEPAAPPTLGPGTRNWRTPPLPRQPGGGRSSTRQLRRLAAVGAVVLVVVWGAAAYAIYQASLPAPPVPGARVVTVQVGDKLLGSDPPRARISWTAGGVRMATLWIANYGTRHQSYQLGQTYRVWAAPGGASLYPSSRLPRRYQLPSASLIAGLSALGLVVTAVSWAGVLLVVSWRRRRSAPSGG